ncbi:hypothetical protein NXS98_03490 [Fontisphaera persica]|uniref:hypothetical protein n=1 Tax=Fontisphaera persica TaxID=2974023 RepID=UPI0024C0CC23|nr:hypothetical protein [Fontisphaera persica]WCJ60204.1 hypothetical protein NXS98_03490 [Fontisphaera persica]
MNKGGNREVDSRVYRTGAVGEPPAPLPLRAGPLRLWLETHTGFLRRVCLGKREVLRGIYVAVRDENWGTIAPRVQEIRREVQGDCFCFEFQCEHREREIDFRWHGMVTGQADGTIIYEMDGEARRSFRKNRIGFCVLHPIRECAGARARQVRTNGEVVVGRFPRRIEPQIFGQSPFRDMRGLAHEVRPGLWAELRFEGEVFEMEDQRNWTDASFKTYCTPLALPFPVWVKAGTRLRQRVVLSLRARGLVRLAGGVSARAKTVQVSWPAEEKAWRPLPKVGLGLATHEEPLGEQEVEWLRDLPLGHVRYDVKISEESWPARWRRAVRQAQGLGAPVEVALHLSADINEIPAALARKLNDSDFRLARVLALREGEAATSKATLEAVRELLGRRAASVPVGAGTDAHFCELNREQALGKVAWREADFLFWPITPQVHAFDDWSLVETLEAQGDTLVTAGAFAPGRPNYITPVTLKPRFNAVATTVEKHALGSDELPPNVDPRQSSLLAAGWTLGALASLSGAGVSGITFYETTGWRGVMETASGKPQARGFYSIAGGVFPVYFVLAALQGFEWVSAPVLSSTGEVSAVGLRGRGGRQRFLVANLQGQPREVELKVGGKRWRVNKLNEKSYLGYCRCPEAFFEEMRLVEEENNWRRGEETGILLGLGPYEVAVVDEV